MAEPFIPGLTPPPAALATMVFNPIKLNLPTYISVYVEGPTLTAEGFKPATRVVTQVHLWNGYWLFASHGLHQDDFKATCAPNSYRTPEQLLMGLMQGDAASGDIMLRWIPSCLEEHQQAIQAKASAHLNAIAQLRLKMHLPTLPNFPPEIPLYPVSMAAAYRTKGMNPRDRNQVTDWFSRIKATRDVNALPSQYGVLDQDHGMHLPPNGAAEGPQPQRELRHLPSPSRTGSGRNRKRRTTTSTSIAESFVEEPELQPQPQSLLDGPRTPMHSLGSQLSKQRQLTENGKKSDGSRGRPESNWLMNRGPLRRSSGRVSELQVSPFLEEELEEPGETVEQPQEQHSFSEQECGPMVGLFKQSQPDPARLLLQPLTAAGYGNGGNNRMAQASPSPFPILQPSSSSRTLQNPMTTRDEAASDAFAFVNSGPLGNPFDNTASNPDAPRLGGEAKAMRRLVEAFDQNNIYYSKDKFSVPRVQDDMKTHSPSLPKYKCLYSPCPYTSSSEPTWKQHMQNFHSRPRSPQGTPPQADVTYLNKGGREGREYLVSTLNPSETAIAAQVTNPTPALACQSDILASSQGLRDRTNGNRKRQHPSDWCQDQTEGFQTDVTATPVLKKTKYGTQTETSSDVTDPDKFLERIKQAREAKRNEFRASSTRNSVPSMDDSREEIADNLAQHNHRRQQSSRYDSTTAYSTVEPGFQMGGHTSAAKNASVKNKQSASTTLRPRTATAASLAGSQRFQGSQGPFLEESPSSDSQDERSTKSDNGEDQTVGYSPSKEMQVDQQDETITGLLTTMEIVAENLPDEGMKWPKVVTEDSTYDDLTSHPCQGQDASKMEGSCTGCGWTQGHDPLCSSYNFKLKPIDQLTDSELQALLNEPDLCEERSTGCFIPADEIRCDWRDPFIDDQPDHEKRADMLDLMDKLGLLPPHVKDKDVSDALKVLAAAMNGNGTEVEILDEDELRLLEWEMDEWDRPMDTIRPRKDSVSD